MRQIFASAMVAVLVVVQTGIAGMCFCSEGSHDEHAGASDTATVANSGDHGCCPNGGANSAAVMGHSDDGAEQLPPAQLSAPCQRGCCEQPQISDIRDRPAEAEGLERPVQWPTLATATFNHRAENSQQHLAGGTASVRAPPPDTQARRLARVQSWLC